MNIALEGHPDIKFDFLKYKTNTNLSVERGENDFLNSKMALMTPPHVTFYQSKRDIYLVWEHPKDPMYKGVRIFRVDNVDNNDEDKVKGPGVEIYEGPGNTNTRVCTAYNLMPSKPVKSWGKYSLDVPPLRKDAKLNKAPKAPTITTFGIVEQVNIKKDKILPFFVDSNICSDYRHKYTLWAYDDNENYSYPVVVKASLKDYPAVVDCNCCCD